MATAEQKAIAEIYRDAAAEHVTAAGELYDLDRMVQANYLAGLAVECLLRGYRYMIDPEFDSRHNLDKLYKLAKFADLVPVSQTEQITAAIGDVIALWSNDHRFLSRGALRKRWTGQRLFEGVKGDFVKELTRRLINAANQIVATGVARWSSSFKS